MCGRYRLHFGVNDPRNLIQVPLPCETQTNNRAHMCGIIHILLVTHVHNHTTTVNFLCANTYKYYTDLGSNVSDETNLHSNMQSHNGSFVRAITIK